MKINRVAIVRVVFFLLIVFISFCSVHKELQNDTFYMIKLGDYIVRHGIDMKDHWVWVYNLSYTYPHWLYDVFIYFIFNFFGFLGVYLSALISYIVLLIVFYYVNYSLNKREFLSMFSTLVLSLTLSFVATARAQVFSYIIFLFEIYYMFNLISNGKKINIVMLCFLSLLLANIHATVWLFFFILFLPFFGEQFIYYLKNKYKFKGNSKLIIGKINYFRYLLISFILSFIMGLFTPSRICYSYVFRIMLGDSQKYILEHQPLIVIMNPMFIGILLLLLIVLIFSKTKIKTHELFMFCGLVFMSLLSFRHIVFFYLIGSLFVSIIVMRYFVEKKDNTLDLLFNLLVKKWYLCLCVLAIVIPIGIFNYSNKRDDYINKKEYPVDAVKFIKKELDYKNIRLFNTYNYGSYLMLNDIPIMIDSRCDLYLKEFNNGVNIFDDVVNIKSNYKDIFDKYNVNYVLIKNDDYLYELLSRDIDGSLYSDKYFTLFKYS